MELIAEKAFLRDLKKIKNAHLRKEIEEILENIELANAINELKR